MRILLTTDTLGGVWTFTRELAVELLRRGHAVALASFGRHPSATQSLWCEAAQAHYKKDFRYVSSPAPLEWMNGNQSAYDEALPVILGLADEFVPDLLHSNQFCFGDMPFTFPTVVTAHSDVLSWAAACGRAPLEPSAWLDRYRFLVQQGLAAANAVVAPTHWMLDALLQHFAVTAPTYVIANGRNLPTISMAAPRKLQAVSCGRLWDEAKNLSLLTQVISKVPILIAGEQVHEGLSASPCQLTYEGILEEPALLELFCSSSFYLAPSLYEPFGLAPLEAALCGCAILANDIPSLHEIWGDAALYFRDADTLGRLLDQLHDEQEYLRIARIKAHHRARQLTATRMADQYLAVYQQLVAPVSQPEREFATDAR